MREPSWADLFRSRYHFRVTFGKLPDGREPVAKVQVIAYSMESAEVKAKAAARSLFRDDPMVLNAKCKAEGYVMYQLGV